MNLSVINVPALALPLKGQASWLTLLLAAVAFTGGTCSSVAEDLPPEVVVRETTTTGLYVEGKLKGAVELKAGQSLKVVRFEKGSFVVDCDGGQAKLDRFNTELARTNLALLQRMTQTLAKPPPQTDAQKTNDITTPQAVAPVKLTPAETANLAFKEAKENHPLYIGDDVDASDKRVKALELLVKAYEAGDSNKIAQLESKFALLKDEQSKQDCSGYKYNEILKHVVATSVRFNLYSDGSDFYFRVGEGDFSTVATVKREDLPAFSESLARLETWVQTCRAEKLETKKPLCKVGTTTFTLITLSEGQMWTVLMEVEGTYRNEAMLTQQKVVLAPINFSRLAYQISNAKEIYTKHLKEVEAAKRLQ